MKFTDLILSFEDICSVLANANGNLSWMELDRTSSKKWTKEEIEERFGTKLITDCVCWEDKLTADLMDGGDIIVVDMYEEVEEDAPHCLTLKDFVDGFKITANRYPQVMANILSENDDLNDADVVMQCVTFGDLIYG